MTRPRTLRRTVSITAVAVMLTVSGCAIHQSAGPVPQVPAVTANPSAAGALPGPDALAEVLYRLSDPDVAGADKVALIADAKPSDAEAIGKFAIALRDSGDLPLHLDITGLSWSDRDPGNVIADVTVNTAHPDTGFSFPMEFTVHDGRWQLSATTAKTLLALSTEQPTSGSPVPPPR